VSIAAKDNSLVKRFFLYRTDGYWWVCFEDENGDPMIHNIDLITPDCIYRRIQPIKWARITSLTKFGAKRLVKKFLAGKIKDFERPERPLP